MRVGKSSNKIASMRLDSAVKLSVEAIRAAGDPAFTLPRFLILLGDSLQSAPPIRPASSGGIVRDPSRRVR